MSFRELYKVVCDSIKQPGIKKPEKIESEHMELRPNDYESIEMEANGLICYY